VYSAPFAVKKAVDPFDGTHPPTPDPQFISNLLKHSSPTLPRDPDFHEFRARPAVR
jgi:hypothetical protein